VGKLTAVNSTLGMARDWHKSSECVELCNCPGPIAFPKDSGWSAGGGSDCKLRHCVQHLVQGANMLA
jgi:hypothetical protein